MKTQYRDPAYEDPIQRPRYTGIPTFLRSPYQQDLEKVEKVSGDASSRQYFRIRTKNKNYILCLDKSYEGPSNNNHFRKIMANFFVSLALFTLKEVISKLM